jgi:protein CsiD
MLVNNAVSNLPGPISEFGYAQTAPETRPGDSSHRLVETRLDVTATHLQAFGGRERSEADRSVDEARRILAFVSPGFPERVRAVLSDRARGGIVVHLPFERPDDIVFAAGLIAQSIGAILPETRRTCGGDMVPEPYVRIGLRAAGDLTGRRRHFADPSLPWPLHTDRTLHEDVGDFLLVGKTVERSGRGGRIRLLHLDDFSRREEFVSHPLAQVSLEWKGDPLLAPLHERPRLLRLSGIMAPVFQQSHDGWRIRFTDNRFRRPISIEQGEYLRQLDAALVEEADRISAFYLPVGGLYIVNNRFWLHGREGFQAVEQSFEREVVRFCGNMVS